MGILIEGMELPKDGELLCINIHPNGKVCINMDLKCKKIATATNVYETNFGAIMPNKGGVIL